MLLEQRIVAAGCTPASEPTAAAQELVVQYFSLTAHRDIAALFRDEDGCDIILRAMLPAAAPDELVDGHTEPFCIEFGHCLRAAAADLAQAADPNS